MFFFSIMHRKMHFHLPPMSFLFVCVISLWTYKFHRVVHCLVDESVLGQVRVCFPSVAHYGGAWFHPLLNMRQYSFFTFVFHCQYKALSWVLFHRKPIILPLRASDGIFSFRSWIHRFARLFLVLQVSDGFQTLSLHKVLDKPCPSPQQCENLDRVVVLFATALILGSTSGKVRLFESASFPDSFLCSVPFPSNLFSAEEVR